jgi:Tol biopolymer transport system component
MLIKPKSKLLAALVVVTVLLALPAAAQATLVFTRNIFHPQVWVANDNGSGAKLLAHGRQPRVSPDGQTVVYERSQKSHGYRTELMLVPANGSSAPRPLLTNWAEPYVFSWSPDSSTIAVLAGSGLGSRSLLTIDLANGSRRTIAKGYFSGASFSPDGSELAYSKAGSEQYPPRSDIYRASLATGKTVRLTKDHRSETPLWGPSGQIVFIKLLDADKRRYGPKSDLFLMNAEGGQVKRLTHTKVDPLLFGLSPTQWSASGDQLLTEFGGQDTSYAVTVNPKTGAEKTLTNERETGFVGTALSADGSTVLGSIGGFEPGPGHKVVTIPYQGGKPKTLANNASEPDWSR